MTRTKKVVEPGSMDEFDRDMARLRERESRGEFDEAENDARIVEPKKNGN